MKISRNEITDNLENILVEVFERTHKCPWYKRFNDYSKKFTYNRWSNGIGTITTVHCNKCGKNFDVTNYDNW